MEIYLYDPEKKIGYYFNEQDKLYHPMNKPLFKKFKEPEYFLEDIRKYIDKRRDCIPVGDEIIFIHEKGKFQLRDSTFYFTWTLNPLCSTPCSHEKYSRFRQDEFLQKLSKTLSSKKYKNLVYKCDEKLAILVTERLSKLEPFFAKTDDRVIFKAEISQTKYHSISKIWVGIVFNYSERTIRRCKIDKMDKELDIHLLIFGNSGKNLTEKDVESLFEIDDDHLLRILFPCLEL